MISKTIGFRGTQHFHTHPCEQKPRPIEGLCSTARCSWGQDVANANHSLPSTSCSLGQRISWNKDLLALWNYQGATFSRKPLCTAKKINNTHQQTTTNNNKHQQTSTNINKHQTMNQPINQSTNLNLQDLPRVTKTCQENSRIHPDLPCLPRLPTKHRPHIGRVPAGRQVYRAPAAQTLQQFAAVLTVQLQKW